MVSLQASLSQEERKASPNLNTFSSKKRKWEEEEESEGDDFAKDTKLWKTEQTKLNSDIELNLDAPLPLEWQRCLDIKSGQIHFYNTRTHKRTSKDPRQSPEPPCSRPTLDLELNLMCEPSESHADGGERTKQESSPNHCNYRNNSSKSSCSPSWVSLNADRQEMVAAVCMRCHMLVMMCKAAPSCPNCKFVHPPSQSSSPLLKPGFRLLCCKD